MAPPMPGGHSKGPCKVGLRGLIAKNGYLGPIWLLEPNYGLFSGNMSWDMYPKVCWMGLRVQKVSF